jgi:hypothetical protein
MEATSDSHRAVATMTPGFLKLPNEVLVKILRPLLQHTEEQANRLFWPGVMKKDPKTASNRPYAVLLFNKTPGADEHVQPQLLRVCKRFNEVGTALLYENELIYIPPVSCGWSSDRVVQSERTFIRQLTHEPRDDAHRLKRIQIHISTPAHFSREAYDGDGEFFDEICAGLARHQPVWDQVAFEVSDYSASERYSVNLEACERLIYGLGRLHAKEVLATCNEGAESDLKWAIEQPGHTIPLKVLQAEMVKYLYVYDPDGYQRWNQGRTAVSVGIETGLKAFLKREGLEAVTNQDEEMFYLVLEMAIEYIRTVLDGGLVDANYTLGRQQDVRESAAKHAEWLLSAKERKWKGRYRIPDPARVDSAALRRARERPGWNLPSHIHYGGLPLPQWMIQEGI